MKIGTWDEFQKEYSRTHKHKPSVRYKVLMKDRESYYDRVKTINESYQIVLDIIARVAKLAEETPKERHTCSSNQCNSTC